MEPFLAGSGPTVNMLLCDSAQANGGKLYMLGGGLAVVGPKPQPLAIALHITLPWDRANIPHEWKISLTDEDGKAVTANEKPLEVRGRFEAGRPAGLRPGTPLGVSLAINIPPLPLPAGRSYTFTLSIDDATEPNWRVTFYKKEAPAT